MISVDYLALCLSGMHIFLYKNSQFLLMNGEFATRKDLSTWHLIKVTLSVIFIQALKYLSHSE